MDDEKTAILGIDSSRVVLFAGVIRFESRSPFRRNVGGRRRNLAVLNGWVSCEIGPSLYERIVERFRQTGAYDLAFEQHVVSGKPFHELAGLRLHFDTRHVGEKKYDVGH